MSFKSFSSGATVAGAKVTGKATPSAPILLKTDKGKPGENANSSARKAPDGKA